MLTFAYDKIIKQMISMLKRNFENVEVVGHYLVYYMDLYEKYYKLSSYNAHWVFTMGRYKINAYLMRIANHLKIDISSVSQYRRLCTTTQCDVLRSSYL